MFVVDLRVNMQRRRQRDAHFIELRLGGHGERIPELARHQRLQRTVIVYRVSNSGIEGFFIMRCLRHNRVAVGIRPPQRRAWRGDQRELIAEQHQTLIDTAVNAVVGAIIGAEFEDEVAGAIVARAGDVTANRERHGRHRPPREYARCPHRRDCRPAR